MNHIRIQIVASLFLLLARELPADSLSALIDEALQNNPGLQAAEQQWHAARQGIKAERGLDDPMIGADVERANTRLDDYMNIEYMASQRLPAWGQRSARVEAAKQRADAAGFRFLETGRNLRASVTEATWNLWLAERRLETMQEMARLAADLADSVRARYESGQAMSADLVRAQIEQAKSTNEVSNLQRERDVALATLNAQLNASPATPRAVDALEPPKEPAEQFASLLAQLRDVDCNLLAIDREAQARSALVRAARRERRPMMEFRVEARQFEGSGGIDEIDTGVFMNLPWIWNNKYKGMIAEADADRQMAEAELQEETRMAEQMVSDLLAQTENAARTAAVLRDSIVPLARQAVEQTQAAYTAGTGSLLERIEAQRTLLESEFDLYSAVAGHARAVARLEQITGPFLEWEQSTGVLKDTP